MHPFFYSRIDIRYSRAFFRDWPGASQSISQKNCRFSKTCCQKSITRCILSSVGFHPSTFSGTRIQSNGRSTRSCIVVGWISWGSGRCIYPRYWLIVKISNTRLASKRAASRFSAASSWRAWTASSSLAANSWLRSVNCSTAILKSFCSTSVPEPIFSSTRSSIRASTNLITVWRGSTRL